jgi:hypothetical protein
VPFLLESKSPEDKAFILLPTESLGQYHDNLKVERGQTIRKTKKIKNKYSQSEVIYKGPGM